MTAIEISSFGPPEVLKPIDRPQPQPAEGEVLIRVAAAGVARADLMQRQGKYPPPHGASDIPGLDVSGIVESLGPGVSAFSPGDKVCAILAGGGYAEYCVAPYQQVLPIPVGWSFLEAATLPENLFTVYDNLVLRANLTKGETVLIHGGSSGIGSMAIMLASLFNSKIIVTAGTPEKCAACLKLGAHHAIDYKAVANFADDVMQFTGGRGVDVILDMVGGPYLQRNLSALATEGRLAIVATQGGHKAELDFLILFRKRARIMASTMRARTPLEKGIVAQALLKNIWPTLPEKKWIRPIIDSVFPFRDASAAHAHLETAHAIGKVILEMD